MKTALITGINGFVGPYLQDELTNFGYKVSGIGKEDVQSSNYHKCDVSDEASVTAIISTIQPNYIYHLAGISSPPFAQKNPELTYDVNVGGTKNILDAAISLNEEPKVLVVSSSHVYGEPQYLPIDERHPLGGGGVYARSRIDQEEVVTGYFDRLPINVTRSFIHTGPGQPDTFVVAKIIKHIVEIKKGLRDNLELGNIDIKRDITDVRDVVRAYRLLLEQDSFGNICNVCRGVSIGLQEIIDKVKSLSDVQDLQVKINPEFVRKNDVKDLYGDNTMLKNIINWDTKIDYDSLIRDMYNYWNEKII